MICLLFYYYHCCSEVFQCHYRGCKQHFCCTCARFLHICPTPFRWLAPLVPCYPYTCSVSTWISTQVVWYCCFGVASLGFDSATTKVSNVLRFHTFLPKLYYLFISVGYQKIQLGTLFGKKSLRLLLFYAKQLCSVMAHFDLGCP